MRRDSLSVKRVAGWVSAFALPLAIVQIIGWLSTAPGPARAVANPSPHEQAASSIEDAFKRIGTQQSILSSLKIAESEAVQRIARLQTEPFGATPMLHASPMTQEEVQSVEPVDIPPDETVDLPPIPHFHLQAVMSSSAVEDARAVINGQLCTLGQNVPGTDWTIVQINADIRRVVLKHSPTQRTVSLTLKNLH